MSKNKKGKELGQGIRQRKDGRYEARAMINGIRISLYNQDLNQLKIDFNKAKEQAKANVDIRNNSITLSEWFEIWFSRYKEPVIKASSVYPMRSKFVNTFGKELGYMRLVDIRSMHIQSAVNNMIASGRASSSIRDALGRLRDCMEAAKHNKIISDNPCFEIAVPTQTKKEERRFMTLYEQIQFLKTVENNWYKEMFYIMFLTGMRIGEVGGLKWSDVDFDNKCIRINQSLSCNYLNGVKKIMLTEPKTHNSYRTIPFIGEAEEMFLSQKKKQEKLKKKLGARYRCEDEFADLVFVTSMGSPVLRYHAERECKKVVAAINEEEAIKSVKEQRAPKMFENVYPHAIRHTFCSRCFEKGMNPKVVQALMGHSSYNTTMSIYTHVTEQKMGEEILKFGKACI